MIRYFIDVFRLTSTSPRIAKIDKDVEMIVIKDNGTGCLVAYEVFGRRKIGDWLFKTSSIVNEAFDYDGMTIETSNSEYEFKRVGIAELDVNRNIIRFFDALRRFDDMDCMWNYNACIVARCHGSFVIPFYNFNLLINAHGDGYVDLEVRDNDMCPFNDMPKIFKTESIDRFEPLLDFVDIQGGFSIESLRLAMQLIASRC